MKAMRTIELRVKTVLALGSAGFLVISAISPSLVWAKDNRETHHFEFAVLGDTGYRPQEITEFEAVIQEMNHENLAFVVHVGDFKGTQACTDEFFEGMKARFQSSAHPLIYTPGDNEWTDCAQQPPFDAAAFGLPLRDPLDALDKIRQLFFIEQGDRSLGQKTLTLVRQSDGGDDPTTPFDESKFVENQRWVYGGIMFVTLHIVGSRDNCPMRTIPTTFQAFYGNQIIDSSCNEKKERTAANVAWLHQTFAEARRINAAGLMLLIQANMLPTERPSRPTSGFGVAVVGPTDSNRIPFNDYLAALEQETLNFDDKPVVLVHGDTHFFRFDKPMRNWFPTSPENVRVDNFFRVETFGSPENKWVRVRVDLRNPNLFVFQQGRPRAHKLGDEEAAPAALRGGGRDRSSNDR